MIEDFTHVLPEDKPIHRKRNEDLFNRIYDLDEAMKRSKYYEDLRTKIEEAEERARSKFFKFKM